MIPRLKEKILLQDILQRTNENNVNEIIIIMSIITIIITIIFIHVILSQGTPRILPNCLRKKANSAKLGYFHVFCCENNWKGLEMLKIESWCVLGEQLWQLVKCDTFVVASVVCLRYLGLVFLSCFADFVTHFWKPLKKNHFQLIHCSSFNSLLALKKAST